MEMKINEIALLWGIQLRPILKSDSFVVKRSEVKNLKESLEYLVRKGYVRCEDIDLNAVKDTMTSLSDSFTHTSKKEFDFDNAAGLLGGLQLFSYIPTEKGKALMMENEHLKAYMKADKIPGRLTLTRFHESYKKASRQFSQDFFDSLTAFMKA